MVSSPTVHLSYCAGYRDTVRLGHDVAGTQSHCAPVLLCRVLGNSETGTRCDWDTVPLCTCPIVPGTGKQ